MQGPAHANEEWWVYEKGLPHSSRGSLFAQLGNRLMVATDLTEVSRSAEERAMQVAARTGARLAIVAVVAAGSAEADAARRLAARIRLARRHGVHATGRIVSGDPGECVCDAARAINADAIIAPDEWRSAPGGGCGCGHIIRHAPCPVLIVKAV
jgi:nucleotide-binding universal stress UspA family protein